MGCRNAGCAKGRFVGCRGGVAALMAALCAAGTAMGGPPAHDEHGGGHAAPGAPAAPAVKPAAGKAAATPKTEAKGESRSEAKGAKPAGAPPTPKETKEAAESAGAREGGEKAGSSRDGKESKEKVEGTPVKGESAPVKVERPTDADEALKWLAEGNGRWVGNKPTNPGSGLERRERLAVEGQKPWAVVLTCADSRLPVERIFDRGTGELFVVRVAGNVAGSSEVGTIEYGVGHLHAGLLVVMGHAKCGAVAAAVTRAEVHGSVAPLVGRIMPAVDRARKQNPGAEGEQLVSAAIRENVWQTVFDLLKQSSEIRRAVADGQLRVVGAVCDVSTGKVEFLGEHPWQDALIGAIEPAKAAKPNGHATAAASDEHR